PISSLIRIDCLVIVPVSWGLVLLGNICFPSRRRILFSFYSPTKADFSTFFICRKVGFLEITPFRGAVTVFVLEVSLRVGREHPIPNPFGGLCIKIYGVANISVLSPALFSIVMSRGSAPANLALKMLRSEYSVQ